MNFDDILQQFLEKYVLELSALFGLGGGGALPRVFSKYLKKV